METPFFFSLKKGDHVARLEAELHRRRGIQSKELLKVRFFLLIIFRACYTMIQMSFSQLKLFCRVYA